MTAQEALAIRKTPVEYEYDKQPNWDELSECIDSALMKQIQKAIKKYTSHPQDIYLCPECGSTFVYRHGVLMRFCSNCGQRLKEVEE